MKRFILILLTCAMLVGCLVSCNIVDTQPNAQPEPEPPAKNDPIDYTKEDDTPNVNISYDMSLVADLYLVVGERIEADSIYIDVTDGKVIIEDVLYDEISYRENIEVKYDTLYNCYDPAISVEYTGEISGTEDEKEILTVMARIVQQKNCYLLKSSSDDAIAEYIVAYYFDGVCYLVFFNEDGVMIKTYSMEVEYVESIFTEGFTLLAKPLAFLNYLSSPGSLMISVKDGEVYNVRLFTLTYYNGIKVDIEYCEENLAKWSDSININMWEVLAQVNDEIGCFVIESVAEEYHEKYGVYCFDNVYYFIDIDRGYRDKKYTGAIYYSPVEGWEAND